MTDPQWCQSSKPILIVFNYRPGPAAVVEQQVEKAEACVQQSCHHDGGTAQVGKLPLVTPSPCTKEKSCRMVSKMNQAAGDTLVPIVAHQTLVPIVAHQTSIHSTTRDSQPTQITPCPVKMTFVTPTKKNKLVEGPLSVAIPLTDEILEIFIGDSPLSKLVKCMNFKRKSRGSRTHSSRFIYQASFAHAEPDRALAKSFINSVFQNSASFIQWTLDPGPNSLLDPQMTFFIQAETNQGLIEVLALAHAKFYRGRGILVRWLAVTGKNILTTQFGGNQDLNGSSWRKRGLSTLLLAFAQDIGRWFDIGIPKMFAEVRADDVGAQAFYKRKGFIKVNQFPPYVEKDLHSHYERHHTQGGCTALGKATETNTKLLHTLELNQWIGKVGDIWV